MVSNDNEILTAAADFEKKRSPRAWGTADVFASTADINRLLEGGFIEKRHGSSNMGGGNFGPALYKLTEKGRTLATVPGQTAIEISRDQIIAALSHIVGYDDIKEDIAFSIEKHNLFHILMEGPPACVKTTILDALQKVIPEPFSYMAFGSRTSARGLSDKLCELRPQLLLFDEVDKIDKDVFSTMLSVLESQRIIETKYKLDRGFNLHTQVIAACNRSDKFPPEFISRFDFHPVFQAYTRQEYVDVVVAMLTKDEQCPPDLAAMIGIQAFDLQLGDVRQARGVRRQMHEPTEEEVKRVLEMKLKYRPETTPATNRRRML